PRRVHDSDGLRRSGDAAIRTRIRRRWAAPPPRRPQALTATATGKHAASANLVPRDKSLPNSSRSWGIGRHDGSVPFQSVLSSRSDPSHEIALLSWSVSHWGLARGLPVTPSRVGLFGSARHV